MSAVAEAKQHLGGIGVIEKIFEQLYSGPVPAATSTAILNLYGYDGSTSEFQIRQSILNPRIGEPFPPFQAARNFCRPFSGKSHPGNT
jgi:hypothetical protein